MTAHDSLKSAYKAVLAGVRVVANRPLDDLPESGEFDLTLDITFVPTGSPEFELPPGAHRLPESGYPRGWLSGDGRHAVVAEQPRERLDIGMAVRGVLPFASALQGAVVLHASAVQCRSGIHAFVAASGAGKSTLAEELARQGLPLVADDLTPCRAQAEGVRVLLPGPDRHDPVSSMLRGLHFLSRGEPSSRVSWERVAPARCIELLMWNGFGELESQRAWAAQFGLYQQAARQVPAYALTVPDDLEQLAATAREVRHAIESLDRQAGR